MVFSWLTHHRLPLLFLFLYIDICNYVLTHALVAWRKPPTNQSNIYVNMNILSPFGLRKIHEFPKWISTCRMHAFIGNTSNARDRSRTTPTSAKIHLSFKCVDVDTWHTWYGVRMANKYLKRDTGALNFIWRWTNIKNQFASSEYPNRNQSLLCQMDKIDRCIWILQIGFVCRPSLRIKNEFC